MAEKLGEPRILINCGRHRGRHEDGQQGRRRHPLDVFRKVLEVNLLGTFNMIRLYAFACAGTRAAGRRGGEASSSTPLPSRPMTARSAQVAYFGLQGRRCGPMTLPIARDLARSGIRVCTIAPGIFKTPMLAGLPPGRAGFARPAGAVPRAAPRRAGRNMARWPAHRGKPDAERRDDPHRRCHPHGAQIGQAILAEEAPRGPLSGLKVIEMAGLGPVPARRADAGRNGR